MWTLNLLRPARARVDMSRGAGHVMVAIRDHLLADDGAHWWSYPALASVVYSVDEPSRAQIGSVARASRRLRELGVIEVRYSDDDLRLIFVGLP